MNARERRRGGGGGGGEAAKAAKPKRPGSSGGGSTASPPPSDYVPMSKEDAPSFAEVGLRLHLQFCLMCLTLVVALHWVQKTLGWDPLAIPFVNGELVSIDSWSFIHVATFACLGFLFPCRPFWFLFYGILWEVLEHFLAEDGVFWHLHLFSDEQVTFSQFWSEHMVNTLWDIWFNILGYRIGEMLLVHWRNSRAGSR
ncbi:hypothetical protein QOT17_005508 [Balamuthia mandrillaris]